MFTILLLSIFLAFIGVGLPDSVLGAAWPVMYPAFGLSISFAGYISATVSLGTILASLVSAKCIHKLGTGRVTAISTLLTAVGLFGFSVTPHPAFFFLFAIPLGLGAGAVDTSLNSFVATHYSAACMSFLHCSYGLGVALSPFIMSLALGDTGNWRRGYCIVACIQLAITIISFATLPIWRRIAEKDAEAKTPTPRTLTLPELVKAPGVVLACLSFFSICALELTAGGWCSTYFVNTKGLPAARAASVTVLLYLGMTCGRFFSGLVAGKLGRRRLLRMSLVGLFAALLLFVLPLSLWVAALALFLLGLSLGPIYPNLMHLTPKFFGADAAESVIGLEQAVTYIGVMVMPWLFGVLAARFSTALLPYFLLANFALYTICLLSLLAVMQKRKKRLCECEKNTMSNF